MQKIGIMTFVVSLLVAACSTSPKIFRRDATPRDLPPLVELAAGKKQLVVVFVHGVGDHCPGYAFDGPKAWVNGKAFRQLGIHGPRGDPRTLRTPVFVYGNGHTIRVGTDHYADGGIRLNYLVTTAEHMGTLGSVSVEGVEITWSLLTYGLKTKELNDDLTNKGIKAKARALKKDFGMTCFRVPPDQQDDDSKPYEQFPPPPPRAFINRIIKEDVLDDELSDAILYLGPYGQVIQRAVAQGICDAIRLAADPNLGTRRGATADTSETDCWYNADIAFAATSQNTEYVIVTHSLGSRIVYDIVRNLNQVNQYHDSPFSKTRGDSTALDVFPRFTCRLGAVYMMANQLPLLGLGAGGTLKDVIADDPWLQSVYESLLMQSPRQPSARVTLPCDRSTNPQFVAFVDTNDPLSWAIAPKIDTTYFDFMTVYVENSWWHWLYANAVKAHTGYFQNREVGAVITCGTRGDAARDHCAL